MTNSGGSLTVFVLFVFFAYTFAFTEEKLRNGTLRNACSARGVVAQPLRRVDTTRRLTALREKMQSEVDLATSRIQAYIVTSSDEHQSVEVEEYERRREYISGFSGSYGDAIITLEKAALWTDGRYHLQADEEMHCDWLLMREGLRHIPTRSQWLKLQFPNGARVGVNPKLISEYKWNKLTKELKNTGIELVALNVSLIDMIWPPEERTPKRSEDVFVLDIKYAGKHYPIKLEETRQMLRDVGADAMVVTSLDEVAWLLNIRGGDVPYSPFARSYVFLDMHSVYLYIDERQLRFNQIQEYLELNVRQRETIEIKKYSDIWPDLRTKSQFYRKILVPSHCVYNEGASHAIYEHITAEKRLPMQSPIIYLKAVKNAVEIENMRKAHVKDAAALCACIADIQKKWDNEDTITEQDIVNTLDHYRDKEKQSFSNSFQTIVGFGANGAQPRYIPLNSTNAIIYNNSTIVIETGAQYYEGTTDVTRTLHFGNPEDVMIDAYTRVLMGNIHLASLTIPNNTKMAAIDVLIRRQLWEVGMDYLHESGHGIGSFLGVREAPIIVQYDSEDSSNQTFKPGYFLTNEPGYYRESYFGVRLQNVFEVVEKPWLTQTLGHAYLGFQIVSLVPFETKLINFGLLSKRQKKWMNWYNGEVRREVGAELKRQENLDGFYWMMDHTQYIPETDFAATLTCQTKLLIITNIVIFLQIF